MNGPVGAAPCLAAVTLDPRGGGIALVARLIQQVIERRWGSRAETITLLGSEGGAQMPVPSVLARVEFGARLAVHQAHGDCGWVFYAHPSLARVQRHVPRAWRQPYAIFVHGIEAWRPLSPAEREVYANASVCVTNSRYTAVRVAQANPGLPALVPCPLSLVPGERPAVAPWRGPRLGRHAVVIVGRMDAAERYKGHDALIAAWPRVRDRVPDAVLVCAGDGDDRPRLEALAAPLGPGTVRFPGFLSDAQLHALYASAALFAMPSRGEGFGLVYLEAMAHGLPCVGSVHDAAGEIIEDGVTGVLVDQDDTDALAERMASLLVDERQRQLMGQRGMTRATHQFGFAQFEQRLLAILDQAGLTQVKPPAARTA